jgi:N-methylhydantoinase B/oxoprolinase/acetone carboxylase alpha subunit
VEIFETRAPILVEERAVLDGTGGDGACPGTPGHRFRLRRRPGSNAEVRLYLHPDRLRHPAPGLFGGGDGNPTRVLLNDRDLTAGTGVLATGEVILATDDDVYTSEVAGGGGSGDPASSR